MELKIHKLLLFLFLAVMFAGQAENKIKQIRSNSMPEKVQIVLDVTEKPSFESFSTKKPTRLIVDVAATPAESYQNKLSFKNRGLLSVRTGLRSKNEVRVVFDLIRDFQWQAYALAPEKNRGHRLVIDIYDHKNKSSNASGKVLASNPIKLESIAPDKVKVKPAKRRTASAVKRTTSVVNKQNQIKKESTTKKEPATIKPAAPQLVETTATIEHGKDIVVMIDPGHGGKDPGAQGPGGTREKDIVLSIAKRLKKKIDAEPGMRAVLTRSTDKYITLRGRLALARQSNVDLFVSIHADAFRDQQANGSSVFILSNGGASSEAARLLAQSENSVDSKYSVDIGDYDKDVSNVLMQIQQDATIESSYLLGKKALSQMKLVGRLHKSSVERAGFAVLKSPDIPSMLVETAFISNPAEEKRLNSAKYQEKIATAITKGIKNYFNEYLPHHLLLINSPN